MRTALVMLCASAAVVLSAPAFSAYGPVLPPGAAPAGGFANVLTGLTLGPGGGTLSAQSGPYRVRVNVPPGTFAVPLQLTLTAPDLFRVQSILDAGRFQALEPLCGVGIGARRDDGAEVRGRLGRTRAALTFGILPRDRPKTVLRWNNARGEYERVGRAPASAGSLTLTFQRAGAFVVVAPKQ